MGCGVVERHLKMAQPAKKIGSFFPLPRQWAETTWASVSRWRPRRRWRRAGPACCSSKGGHRRVVWHPGFPRWPFRAEVSPTPASATASQRRPCRRWGWSSKFWLAATAGSWRVPSFLTQNRTLFQKTFLNILRYRIVSRLERKQTFNASNFQLSGIMDSSSPFILWLRVRIPIQLLPTYALLCEEKKKLIQMVNNLPIGR